MEELIYLNSNEIVPNPYQPRLHFDQEQLKELAASIKENGIIQPLIVRKSAIIGYELLAGERRWRACQLLGIDTIPVIVKKLSDEDMIYQSIIENLQRADLNPIEEAKSYQNLIKKGFTHEEIAHIIGKSRPYITNSIRLLQLSPHTIKAVENGDISQGHARLLISYDETTQKKWVKNIIEEQISVRTLEKALSYQKRKKEKKYSDIFIDTQTEILHQLLGTDVKIQSTKKGNGKLIISFSDLEEFDRIIQRIK